MLLSLLLSCTMSAEVSYEMHYGPISAQHREQLLPLRSTLFHDYPYLYVSNCEREAVLWDVLSRKSTLLALAYDNRELVGAVIALGIGDDNEHVVLQQHRAFHEGCCLEIAMIMVAKRYQRRGIARKLVGSIEATARSQGYTDLYGITVVRSANHPLKPEVFANLDDICSHLGGTPTGLTAAWNWPTRCGMPGNEIVAPVDNMVQYWHKHITE